MSWKVEINKVARREYRLLEDGPRQAAADLLLDREEEGPIQIEAIQLRGLPDTWRVRFHHDRYRMIYLVAKAQRRIIVKRIRPRSTAYAGMKNP